MSEKIECPHCGSTDILFSKKRQQHICEDCQRAFQLKKAFAAKRVFISYGHDRHASLAEKIKQDLAQRGHKIWFDKERLQPGGDWESYIEEGLKWVAEDKAQGRVVLLMTPHSVRRPDGYCLNEIARALASGLYIVPVMVVWSEPPLSICRIQWLDMQDCVPVNERVEKYESKFELFIDALEQDKLDFEGTQSRLLHLLNPPEFEANINNHLRRFTGRQWVFDEIDAWLAERDAPRIFWIVGSPGVGKTAITSYLCQHKREVAAFHLCQFGNFEKSDPRKCILSIAYQLSSQLPDYQNRLNGLNLESLIPNSNSLTLFDTLVVQPLSNNFPAPDRIIVVLIDALDEATKDGKNELASFLASEFTLTPAWLRLIITSRPDPEVLRPLQGYTPYQLDTSLSKNQADLRDYLVRELKPFADGEIIPDSTIDFILERSEGLFLYVEHIRNELELGRLSLDRLEEFPKGLGGSYSKFFDRQFPNINDFKNLVRSPLEVISTSQEPLKVEMLASIFDWNDYQLAEFKQSIGSLFPVIDGRIQPFHRSLTDWLTDPDKAGNFFVSITEGHKSLADHGWKLYLKSASELPDYFLRHLAEHLIVLSRWDDLEKFLSDLNVFEKIWEQGRRYEWMRYWQPISSQNNPGESYQTSLDKLKQSEPDVQRIARLADIIGWFLRDMGFYSGALPFTEQSLKLRENLLGENHPDIADCVHNFAELYRAQKNYDRAEPLYQRALRIRENSFGRESAEVARILHDMAEFFHDQKKYPKALDYYQQALNISEKVLKPNAPAIADCLNDLGTLYYELCNTNEALPRYDRAFEIYKTAYGNDHPDVAAVLHNKALVYRDEQRYDDAVHYCSNALDILERTFPAHHPKVERCIESLENIYATCGNIEKVIFLRQRLFEIKEQVLGPNHLEVMTDLFRLALLFRQINDDDSAVSAYQRVLTVLEIELGSDSPEVSTVLENLSWTLHHQGNFERAVFYARKRVDIQEKIAGTESSETAVSLNTLLRCLQDKGDYFEALPLCRRTLSIREKILDPNDPKIAESLNNLGLTLVCLNQPEEAEKHLRRAIEIDAYTPNPHYWLAKLYQKRNHAGDNVRERAAWRKYLELGAPIQSRKEEATNRIAELT